MGLVSWVAIYDIHTQAPALLYYSHQSVLIYHLSDTVNIYLGHGLVYYMRHRLNMY